MKARAALGLCSTADSCDRDTPSEREGGTTVRAQALEAARAQITALSPSSCVAMAGDLAASQFPCLKNEDDNTYLMGCCEN